MAPASASASASSASSASPPTHPRRCPDRAAIDRLVAAAARAQSDTLLVLQDGEVLVERTFGPDPGPLETRSLTKGLVTLALLALVADGELRSLDAPLSTFFPEFGAGEKAKITVRHVLTHTTGLRHAATDADALNAQADRLAYARALPVVDPPGEVWGYSNEAFALLGGVVASAAGEPVDAYMARRVFAPLGITDVPWKRDRSGAAQTYYGVALTARQLAKVGALLLGEGRVDGRELLPAALVRELFLPSERFGGYGLGFWLDPAVTQTPAGRAALRDERALSARAFEALAPLDDRPFDAGESFFEAAAPLVDPGTLARLRALHRAGKAHLVPRRERARALFGIGGLGQRLDVYPEARLVAVRQHRRRPGDDAREAQVTFRAMPALTLPLTRPCPSQD